MKTNWVKCLFRVNMGLGANCLLLAGASAVMVDTALKIIERINKDETETSEQHVVFVNDGIDSEDVHQIFERFTSLTGDLSELEYNQKKMNDSLSNLSARLDDIIKVMSVNANAHEKSFAHIKKSHEEMDESLKSIDQVLCVNACNFDASINQITKMLKNLDMTSGDVFDQLTERCLKNCQRVKDGGETE